MREFMTFDSRAAVGRGKDSASDSFSSLNDFALSHLISVSSVAANHGSTVGNLSLLSTSGTDFSRPELAGKVTGLDHDGVWQDYGEVNLKTLGIQFNPALSVSIDGASLKSFDSLSFAKFGFASEIENIPAAVSINGAIAPDTDDVDFYAFNLTGGQAYMFSLYGSGGDPLSDTFLYIYDGDGNLVDFDDDGGVGVNSLYTFTPDADGLYYIGAGAYPGSGLGGTYTLDVVVQPATDVVGDTFATASTLNFGDDNLTYGFIDPGAGPYGGGFSEADTYSFTAEAGMYYTFEIAGGHDYNTDWFDLPPGELDTLVIIYDADGNQVAFNDDISFPSDVSSRVGFFAEEGGTYYLDVISYAPYTGGFSIRAQEVDLSTLDPLDSIDWVNADNITYDHDNIAYVYFGNSDENFGQTGDDGDPMVTIDWNDYEKQQVMEALHEYERILGVKYEITDDVDAATFRLLKTESQQYGAYFFPQDPIYGDNQGVGVFNVLSGGWNFDQQQSLEQGGFSFAVILHEFGHAHGLAHPHDQGGGSDVMVGVAGSSGLGVYDLNQGVYTVMSYNDAWELHPDGPSPFTAAGVDHGWSGTLSAFDIAVLQERYGIHSLTAGGNNRYELSGDEARGTYYETIWDTGGSDIISYSGDKNARIDLTAATLDYSPTGGGVVSYVEGVHGGFTIAGGVVIERAFGGSGNDTLIGNDADNVLMGNGGDDWLIGRGGARDILDGGDGYDTAYYRDEDGGVVARLFGAEGRVFGADGSKDILRSIEEFRGTDYDDRVIGSNDVDVVYGYNGNDVIKGRGGDDILNGLGGDDILVGGAGDDRLNGGRGADDYRGGAGADLLVFGRIETGDEIFGFESGTDQIDLTPTGVDFTFVGDSAFTGTAGELRYAGNELQGDVDGDGVADLVISVYGDDVVAADLIII